MPDDVRGVTVRQAHQSGRQDLGSGTSHIQDSAQHPVLSRVHGSYFDLTVPMGRETRTKGSQLWVTRLRAQLSSSGYHEVETVPRIDLAEGFQGPTFDGL